MAFTFQPQPCAITGNLFVAGGDDVEGAAGLQVFQLRQTAPNNGWSWILPGIAPPGTSGGIASALMAAGGIFDIFSFELLLGFIGVDGRLHTASSGGLGDWGDWKVLGDALSGGPVWPPQGFPAAIVVTTNGGAVLAFSPFNWELESLPPLNIANGSPCLLNSADSRRELFVVGTDNNLWHVWDLPGTLSWGGQWFSHGAPGTIWSPNSFAGAQSQDRRLELFGVDTAGTLWHTWQLAPGGQWSDTDQGWFSHGTPAGTMCVGRPAIARDLNGLCSLFTVGGDGALWRISQVQPSSGWTDWISHRTPPATTLWASPAVTASADGRLEVFVLGADSNLWHIWQTDAEGNWSDWFSHAQPS